MYHTKKIIYFISHIYGDYQISLTEGICSKVQEYGYPLEIYTTNDGEDLGDYSIGEESILKIPNFDDIAGAIFASGTYVDPVLKVKITDFFKSHPEIPVVEVSESNPTFTSVSMNNNNVVADLTAHVIKSHKAVKVCYLGDAIQRLYSDKREHLYRATMAEHNLEVKDNYVYLYNETSEDCGRAFDAFSLDGKPDAVICYNDDAALKLMEYVLQKGYKVPEDIIITGSDNTEGARNVTPSLTSVTFPLYEVGTEAVNSLVSMINGNKPDNVVVSATPIYRESCGCQLSNRINSFEYLRNRSKKILKLEKSMLLSMKMSTALSHAKDLDEGCDIISDFIGEIDKLNEFYMCLYPDWNRIDDETVAFLQLDNAGSYAADSVDLKLGIKNGKRVPECSFVKRAILPEFVSSDENKTFLVSPLFFENRAFGYIAMSFEDGIIRFPFNLVQWLTNIAQFLQDICAEEKTALMAKHLEEMYLKDQLTGLKNRHSFNKEVDSLNYSGQYVSLVMIDLDRLKYINDNFGHEEGDFALKTIGQALLSIEDEKDICARFGGDEFYCLLVHSNPDYAETFVSRIHKYLANFNNLSGKPYKITASIGFDTVKDFKPDELSDYLRSADLKMYEIKRNRKNI